MNELFDLNVHLPCQAVELGSRLDEESRAGKEELLHCFSRYHSSLPSDVRGSNFMLFNTELPASEIDSAITGIRKVSPGSKFTTLVDFRAPDAKDRVVLLKDAGVDAIKFHCYVQGIEETEYPAVVDLAVVARSLHLPVFLDTSYGTTGLYRYDNLRLAASILRKIDDIPVVLLHSGGARIFDAFLLADACANTFLETSFTLNFLMGSTIEQDLAFCYKKLGVGRVGFGSDSPYVPFEGARQAMEKFLDRFDFSDAERGGIYRGAAESIFTTNG